MRLLGLQWDYIYLFKTVLHIDTISSPLFRAVRFQTTFHEKITILKRKCLQNVAFLHLRVHLFVVVFYQKKKKAEILDKRSGKTPCTRATNLKKCNVFFLLVHSRFFSVFLSKKITKGEISDHFSAKTPCTRATILKKCNVFLRLVHSPFFAVFLYKKRTNGEISDHFSAKTPYTRATILEKCNVFLPPST